MSKRIRRFLSLPAVILLASAPLVAQESQTRAAPPIAYAPQTIPGSQVYGGYEIGVGDVLDIHVNDEESVSGRYQVDQDGKVRVPLLSDPIQAAGSTTFDLASRLREQLKAQKILLDPGVTVLIAREVTQNVSVIGAVLRPGVYPLEKPTTIMDVISLAGGLAVNAGDTLTISHVAVAGEPSDNRQVERVSSINLVSLVSGKDPSLNTQVHAGDVITVLTAPVVFVVGAVGRPGAFTVQDPRSHMTVLQALAMAMGTTSTAALGRAIIIRKSSEGDAERQDIPLDLKKMMRGKIKDETLEANDILFVPQSALKASLHRMGDIGASAAGEATGYAVGVGLVP